MLGKENSRSVWLFESPGSRSALSFKLNSSKLGRSKYAFDLSSLDVRDLR